MNSINGMAGRYNTATMNEILKSIKPAETEQTEAEKLEAFKKEIWNEINSMPRNSSMNKSIQITEDAFKRMMEEPKFKDEMMSMLRQGAMASLNSLCNNTSGITTITKDGQSGIMWHNENCINPPSFEDHAKDAFYVKRAKKPSDNNASDKLREERMLYQRMFERNKEARERDEEHLNGLMEKKRLSQREIALSRYEQNQIYL